MYMRNMMICKVSTFSYNRPPRGGALYDGNIGSVKDRCVLDTCENLKNVNFFRFSLLTSLLHLKTLWDLQSQCFAKTQGLNIQKRTIADQP